MQNKIRVAITTEGENVSAHFGQCPQFTICEFANGKLIDKKVVANTAEHGGGGCVAVDEILKHNINYVISGGMGMGAQQKFANAGVTVHGYSGKVEDAIKDFSANKLGGLDSCREHGDCH
jgi:predicted Fe-Mo cluster-binding NifX family protein